MLRLAIIMCMAFATSAVGQQIWVVDSAHVRFTIRNAGFDVQGTFQGFNGDINFDPDNLPNSHIHASIDAVTVSTGIRIRDKHLRKWDFLDAEQYPRISMRSRELRRLSEGSYTGSFSLDLKGRHQELEVPFHCFSRNGHLIFDGEFSINRRDFDIGGNSPILADTLAVHIWLSVSKK